MNLYRSKFRSGISNCISVAFRPRSDQPFTSLYCFSGLRGSVDSPLSQNIHSCSQACQSKVVRSEIIGFPVLENLSRKFASVKVKENLPLPCALSFRSFIHYGNPKQPENGSISRSMDSVGGIIEENGHDRFEGPQFANNDVEQNADVVHNKMLRSNRFGEPQFAHNDVEQNADVVHNKMLRSLRFEGPQFALNDVEQNADVVHNKMLRSNRFGGPQFAHNRFGGPQIANNDVEQNADVVHNKMLRSLRFGGPQFALNDVEQNADVVHNKMLRSNRFGGPQFAHNRFGGPQFAHNDVEQNADVVHIKMLRNNTFITLTDSKGNKKPGEGVSASAGSLPDKGGKVSRYGAEATAEHCGREARKSGIKSVVVKVNGLTYFKKKRQAIMAFREGYTHGRGDETPIVYIEDTTRRPHNGCRLRKKRRI